jgi:membrane associated rhomboid family serine protease
MFIPLHDANQLRHIRLQYVTLAIIVINIVVWLVFATIGMSDAKTVKAAFFSYGFVPAVANGYQTLPPEWAVLPEPLTYVTYAFVHGNFMHLVGNMLFIWVFADNIEDATGHIRFIFFFLICAAAGAFAHSLAQPESVSPLIGASGAAAGVITAYLMLHPRVKVWVLALGRIPLRIPAMWVIGAWILFQIGNLVLSASDEVSWAAHIGGITAGAILLPLLKRKDVPLFDHGPPNVVVTPEPQPEPAPQMPAPTDPALGQDRGPAGGEHPSSPPLAPWGRQPRQP